MASTASSSRSARKSGSAKKSGSARKRGSARKSGPARKGSPARSKASGRRRVQRPSLVSEVTRVARSVGRPGLAAGAGAATVVGGLAVRARRRKKSGLPGGLDVHGLLKQFGKTTKRVGKASKQVGEEMHQLGDDVERVGKTLS
jgi:hypothetical protein